VLNNGWTSRYINIQSGVRQGCPLSPYIFVICAEVLSITLRNNKNIKGIKVENCETKIHQYADDTCITILACRTSLNETIKLFEEFQSFSNMKVNFDKTEILRVGPIKNSEFYIPTLTNFKWTNGPSQILGVMMSTDVNSIENLNYEGKVKEIVNTLKMWKSRHLTIIGKICVINTIALSKLAYLVSVLGTPDENMLTDIQKAIFSFIWNDKPDQIKREILLLPKEEGGLGLKNVTLMCKSTKISFVQ
jgi:hypothetical protein